jgi:predicted nucleic-acid-binding Zn-ribbon protein
MPSENDDTKYSLFGDDESSDGRDDPADAGGRDGAGTDRDGDAGGPAASGERTDAASDDRPASLGGDGEGCPKCGGTETETDEIATSGTGLTKMFDVQNRRFVVVSCAKCGYSELYKGQSSGDAIDFFLG